MLDKDEIRKAVSKNYSGVALKGFAGSCCKGNCGCGNAHDIKESSLKSGYLESDLASVPQESNMGLGCGNPVAAAALKKGETVLDLGSGGGFDCFLAGNKVGETGYVIGVDMTLDMVMLARRNAAKKGYENISFRLGEIEHLPVADESVDVIISNCVINLSPDKRQVFKEAYRVMKKGGRFIISDTVSSKKLDEKTKSDLKLITSCIAGAEYIEDLRDIITAAGFKDITFRQKENSAEIISSWLDGNGYSGSIASYIIEAVK